MATASSAWATSSLPVATMILASGVSARISRSRANPSLAPSGSGGRPRSTIATGGRSRLIMAQAASRVCAIDTWYSGNAQRYCRIRPSSSSTISSFGLFIRPPERPRERPARPYGRHRATGYAWSCRCRGGLLREDRRPPRAAARGLGRCRSRSRRAWSRQRLKQPVPDEFGRHSGTLVADIDGDAQPLVPHPDRYGSGRGLEGILAQMDEDRAEIVGVHRDRRAVSVMFEIDRHAAPAQRRHFFLDQRDRHDEIAA